MDDRLIIKIDNTKPVAISDFVASFAAVHDNYRLFLERHNVPLEKDQSVLYIRTLREGSIIAELVPYAAKIMPLLSEVNTVKEFLVYTQTIYDWLMGQRTAPRENITPREIRNAKNALDIIRNDNGAVQHFTAMDGGQINFITNITHAESQAIGYGADKELRQLQEKDANFRSRVVMVWHQARFVGESKTGNKALIETVSKSPLPVAFNDQNMRVHMMTNDPRFEKPWQQLAYWVDVEVQTINSRPVAYKIMNWYPEDTFEPES